LWSFISAPDASDNESIFSFGQIIYQKVKNALLVATLLASGVLAATQPRMAATADMRWPQFRSDTENQHRGA
jgi:hypothetical protein